MARGDESIFRESGDAGVIVLRLAAHYCSGRAAATGGSYRTSEKRGESATALLRAGGRNRPAEEANAIAPGSGAEREGEGVQRAGSRMRTVPRGRESEPTRGRQERAEEGATRRVGAASLPALNPRGAQRSRRGRARWNGETRQGVGRGGSADSAGEVPGRLERAAAGLPAVDQRELARTSGSGGRARYAGRAASLRRRGRTGGVNLRP